MDHQANATLDNLTKKGGRPALYVQSDFLTSHPTVERMTSGLNPTKVLALHPTPGVGYENAEGCFARSHRRHVRGSGGLCTGRAREEGRNGEGGESREAGQPY